MNLMHRGHIFQGNKDWDGKYFFICGKSRFHVVTVHFLCSIFLGTLPLMMKALSINDYGRKVVRGSHWLKM